MIFDSYRKYQDDFNKKSNDFNKNVFNKTITMLLVYIFVFKNFIKIDI